MEKVEGKNYTLILGDCLEIMPHLESSSVNLVLSDLPYETSYCKWDSIIPLEKLWLEYKRLIIGTSALVFTAIQPFTTKLINSNPSWFRYEWIWNKENASNFANCKKQPLKQHENILVFSSGQSPYYPIKVEGKKNHKQGKSVLNYSESRLISGRVKDDLSGMKYPKTILNFPKHSSGCKFHPTEKPVSLMEYLVKTYSNEGETILDNACGSGSVGLATVATGRKFIGIEKEKKYFDIAVNRLQKL